jgi:hypothetical protein
MPDFGRWTSNGGDPSLNDINRVDRFLDALGSKETAYSTDHAEAELAFLLADWRDDIRDAPVTAPVTTRDAAIALRGGLTSRKRSRTSLALVGSVAAAVLCIGGFGAAVLGSGPGDPFYAMRTTMFGQEQVRNEQVTLASQQLQQVQQLIDPGDWQQAQDKLAALSATVQDVEAPQEQKQDLIQQWNTLTYKVVQQDPAATLPPPGEPLPVLPDSPLTLLPLPVIDTSTSSSSTTSTSTDTSSSETPGPESVPPTSPTSPGETSSPTSATSPGETSSPTSTTTTTTSVPTTTTTTTTTIAAPPKSAEVTSVTSVPQAVVPAPPTSAAPPVAASVPPPQPQVAPSSSIAAPPPPAQPAPAPPAEKSSAPSASVAPSQAEPTTVTQAPPKKPSEQPVVTTTTTTIEAPR